MPSPRLFQIAHDTRNPDGTVTTIRGTAESREEAERTARQLGGAWYVRHIAAPDLVLRQAERDSVAGLTR